MLMSWMSLMKILIFLRDFSLTNNNALVTKRSIRCFCFFFFAINQNWVMKTARGPRVNELDEFDEDEFNDDNDGFDIRRKLILGSYQSPLMVYESSNLCINTRACLDPQ